MRRPLYLFYHSFPIQLLLLHFRKSQLLLLFWGILFSTIMGHFMKSFSADGLFLSPEYLGQVNYLSGFIVGAACGIYIITWHVITFIIHSKRFRFLAATSNPFLKYYLNNSIIPIVFLMIYGWEAYHYATKYELISVGQFFLGVLAFCIGLVLIHIISFAYLFRADKYVIRTIKTGIIDFEADDTSDDAEEQAQREYSEYGLPVAYYFRSLFKVRKARNVSHYGNQFLDAIFKKHHFSAMMTILAAFIFTLILGFFQDSPIFQLPAGASVFITFSLGLALIGGLSYFLRSWSFLVVVLLYVLLNTLYRNDVISLKNRAYGLDYAGKNRPEYSLDALNKLTSPDKIAADKKNMISILNRWKAKQHEEKPLFLILNFSGGGLKSAAFSMNVLQRADSLLNGQLMHRSFMITGASGGMLAAAYFRELSRLKDKGYLINLQDKSYLSDISEDLLNPVFSSLVARDFISPHQKFRYNGFEYSKDRGYAFERKLSRNTGNFLNTDIGFYKEFESKAQVPLVFYSSSVVKDLKRMIISTQPISYMMEDPDSDPQHNTSGPDAIDFGALFAGRQPMRVSTLSALRMNATYPYVLPSVWLPTRPKIEVMDAGLRDNFGTELSLRFVNVFKEWIQENTRGVLILDVRAREKGTWNAQKEKSSILDPITKPFSMLQLNWFNLQDYFHDDEMDYLKQAITVPMDRITIRYSPVSKQAPAPLSFHLTAREKKEVENSIFKQVNREALAKFIQMMQQ